MSMGMTGVGILVTAGAASNLLLLETGDKILLENGDFFALE